MKQSVSSINVHITKVVTRCFTYSSYSWLYLLFFVSLFSFLAIFADVPPKSRFTRHVTYLMSLCKNRVKPAQYRTLGHCVAVL